MPGDVIKVVNNLGEQDDMQTGIEFHNIHHESTLSDLFADKDLNDDNSNASDQDWGENKNPEDDLQMIEFDNNVDDTEVQDLNIENEDILHLYDGSDLSCNVGIQHKKEDQHNHFGGPQWTRTIQKNNSIIMSKTTTLMKTLMKTPLPMKEYT